jgi:hypothetical protein
MNNLVNIISNPIPRGLIKLNIDTIRPRGGVSFHTFQNNKDFLFVRDGVTIVFSWEAGLLREA